MGRTHSQNTMGKNKKTANKAGKQPKDTLLHGAAPAEEYFEPGVYDDFVPEDPLPQRGRNASTRSRRPRKQRQKNSNKGQWSARVDAQLLLVQKDTPPNIIPSKAEMRAARRAAKREAARREGPGPADDGYETPPGEEYHSSYWKPPKVRKGK